jgi:dipeptidyl aminopeptidase/acylaminoacyl peptidase
MLPRVLLVVAVLALAGSAFAKPAAPAAPPPNPNGPLPISAFYQDPAISQAQISSDGKWVAMFRTKKNVDGLLIYDLTAHTSSIAFNNADKNLHLNWVRWKGDDRLIVGMTYLEIDRLGGKPDGEIINMRYSRFLVAMDRDGKNVVQLAKSNAGRARFFGYSLDLLDPLKNDPDHILARAPTPLGEPAVWRVDVHTGAAQQIETGDDHTLGWDTDRNGDVVARLETRGRDVVIQGRAPGEKAWTEVTRVRPKEIKALSDFEFLGAANNAAQLYVAVKPETPDQGAARAVRIYDFKTHTLSKPVWPALDYDVSDIVTDDATNALLGVCYWVDTYRCDYKDADVQANFRAIDRYFEGDRSATPVSRSDDGRWWLLLVSGPTEPASYYLYDWTNKSMDRLGKLQPQLPAEKLGIMQRFTYKASDGKQIRGYLTRPPGAPKGPLPLVVLPHGGPEARDDFDFDTWSQIIATRGYLVFQPNFRGSGGYGVAYAEAGYGQWGRRMQDDITDGVKALVDAGQADPARICIFGASYGGYAALIGGALRPDLYKCVVSWAGISDLTKMMRIDKGGLFVGERSAAYDYELKAIGDPEVDKQRLAETSAITYADKYGPPVLLIHGDSDTNVPSFQSIDMDHALKAAGRDVRLVIVKGEDHSGWSPEHEQTAIGDVVDFITAHIAPAKLSPVSPPADVATK